MRIFRTGTPWYFMCRCAGSAIPGSLFLGTASAVVTLAIELFVPHEYMDRLLQHPYPFQPFAYVFAFALVFRTNVAYNRYSEMMLQCTLMAAKWGDACAEALSFDELINTNKRPTGEEGARWLEQRRHFQALLIRRFSLLHALAMQYVRRDDHLENLVKASGRDPGMPFGLGAFGGMEQPTSRGDPQWQQLEVIGGVTPSEVDGLLASADRVGFVFAQILHLSNQRRADGGLGADAPVLSRYYQTLSDGMLGFRQARKIEDICFPWPYTQAISVMLWIFALVFPLILSHFANCGADRTCDQPVWWLGPFIGFVTTASYVTLQEVARALEDPFVHPPNDLPANALQAAFNGRLLTTWDAIRTPADVVQAQLPSNGTPGAPAPIVPDAESQVWGEYALLVDLDVRRASETVVLEWRAHGKNQRAKVFVGKGQVSTPNLVKKSRPPPWGHTQPSPSPSSAAVMLSRSSSRERSSGMLPEVQFGAISDVGMHD